MDLTPQECDAIQEMLAEEGIEGPGLRVVDNSVSIKVRHHMNFVSRKNGPGVCSECR